jgi:Putative glucoamylase/Protein of unknown function (DUF3131)
MQRRLVPLLALAAALGLAAPAATADRPPTRSEVATLQEYAADTWQSFLMMLSPTTGLPSDNVSAEGVRARYTSPTNIGAYLWSTIAARDLGIIKPSEARERVERTLASLARLERHPASGQFYNWYDPDTGTKLRVWPNDGSTVYPFLSSVDNGWLAAALMMVERAVPQSRAEAETILRDMDFGFYYDPAAGLIRGGFWDEPPPGCFVLDNYRDRGPDVYYTCHHYGALNTEPRIASYIGIAHGQIPPTHYYKMWRTFPDTCDWSWQEMRPEGVTRTYLGVDVYEGHYRYRGKRLVPTWGGSMFEALMVPLFVPEEDWAPSSWGVNHPLYVEAQIEHGLEEADYGYWGFSPSNNPDGGYREYGVDPIGLEPNGYASDQERTFVDYGFEGCRPGAPEPATYGRGVVTPHASFLALEYDAAAALENLANLRRDFDAYGEGGFFDAIEVRTGTVSRYYLALDQGMVMAAIANELRGDRMRDYFTHGAVERHVRPTIAPEEFTAGRG